MLACNSLVLGLNYADRAVIGVAAPLIIAGLGLSPSAFGWILAAFAFTYSPFGFVGGWLADRYGPRRVMGWAAPVAGAVQMFATTPSIIAPAATGYLVESPLGWTGTFGIACAMAVFGAALLACFGHNETRLRRTASADDRVG